MGKVHWHIISEQNLWDCPGATLFSSFVHIYVSPAKRSVASDAGAEQEQGEQNATWLDSGLKSILKMDEQFWSQAHKVLCVPWTKKRVKSLSLKFSINLWILVSIFASSILGSPRAILNCHLQYPLLFSHLYHQTWLGWKVSSPKTGQLSYLLNKRPLTTRRCMKIWIRLQNRF